MEQPRLFHAEHLPIRQASTFVCSFAYRLKVMPQSLLSAPSDLRKLVRNAG